MVAVAGSWNLEYVWIGFNVGLTLLSEVLDEMEGDATLLLLFDVENESFRIPFFKLFNRLKGEVFVGGGTAVDCMGKLISVTFGLWWLAVVVEDTDGNKWKSELRFKFGELIS